MYSKILQIIILQNNIKSNRKRLVLPVFIKRIAGGFKIYFWLRKSDRKWLRVPSVLRILILKRIKDRIRGQSMTPDNNFRNNFESRSKRRQLIRVRKFKILSYKPWEGLWMLNLNEINR